MKSIPKTAGIEFTFGPPNWWGSPEMPQSYGAYSYLGLIPPRLNKTYEQNPISKAMLDSIRDLCPESLTFWGVGFTKSDTDLCELFKNWINQKYNRPEVNIINPDYRVVSRFQEIAENENLNYFTKAENYAHEKFGMIDFGTILKYDPILNKWLCI